MKNDKTDKTGWANRIVGEALVDPATLKPHLKNWRRHPQVQRAAMTEVLSDVGWVQRVVINKLTGNIVDGHMRVDLALKQKQKVPVVYVELSAEEESKMLAVMDPISGMALAEPDMLRSLMEDFSSEMDSFLGSSLTEILMQSQDGQLKSDKVSPDRKMGDKRKQMKPVLYCDEVSVFERAIQVASKNLKTTNRGKALIAICREYIDSHVTR